MAGEVDNIKNMIYSLVLWRNSRMKCKNELNCVVLRNHINATRKLFMDNMNPEFTFNETQMSLEDINITYGTKFHEGHFCVAVLVVDHLHDPYKVLDLLPDLNGNVISLINTLLGPYCFDILYNLRFNEIILTINYSIDNEEIIKEELNKILRKADAVIKEFYDNLCITLCIGGIYDSVHCLKKSRKEAHNAAWSRMSMAGQRQKLIVWKCSGVLPDHFRHQVEDIGNKIRRSCESLDIYELKKNIELLFLLPETILNLAEVKAIAMDSLDYFCNIHSDLIETFTEKSKFYMNTKNMLLISKRFIEYKNNYIKLFSDIFQKIIDVSNNKKSFPIKTAIYYVQDHYAEKIGLEDVAKKACLNPVYFSYVFKRETGKNFIDYLTEYRIQVAKNMLKQGERRIKEISNMVGYFDQKYFSKLFKKHVGIKPTAYRKIASIILPEN
jgi:two-component system response regulator YesN